MHGGAESRQIYRISASPLAGVYSWSHDCISRKRRVEGEEEEETASPWTLLFHTRQSDRRVGLVPVSHVFGFTDMGYINLFIDQC